MDHLRPKRSIKLTTKYEQYKKKESEKKPKKATNRLEDVHSIVCSKISSQISEKKKKINNKDVLSSNPQDIGKIEESSDTLKDSDDSKDQTNEVKTPEADEDETSNTGMI